MNSKLIYLRSNFNYDLFKPQQTPTDRPPSTIPATDRPSIGEKSPQIDPAVKSPDDHTEEKVEPERKSTAKPGDDSAEGRKSSGLKSPPTEPERKSTAKPADDYAEERKSSGLKSPPVEAERKSTAKPSTDADADRKSSGLKSPPTEPERKSTGKPADEHAEFPHTEAVSRFSLVYSRSYFQRT